MAIVSLSEAARLAGKSRKTIQRYVADGRLSMSQDVQDKKGIDTSELMRVFGNLSHPVAGTVDETISQHAASSVPDVAALEARIKVLETEAQAKDELLVAKERHLASLEQALRLLQGPEKQRRWWHFGR
jgi:hypothetical protein